MSAFTFYEHGTTTAFTSEAFGTVDAGDVSATKTADVWYNHGTNGGNSGAFRIRAFVLDGGVYVDSGVPALDNHAIQMRINGVDRTGDATQASYVSPWVNVGSGVDLECPPLSGNCAWVVEIRIAPPIISGAVTATLQLAFSALYNDVTTSYDATAGHFPNGILTGLGDRGLNEWIDAPAVSTSGADFTAGASSWLDAGRRRNKVAETYTFNGTAANGALSSGQEYQAIVSQPIAGGSLTVTKGNKATAGSSVTPTLPADNLFIRVVTVPYGVASLTTSGAAYSGRGKVETVSGLTVRVCPLRGLFSGRPWNSGSPIESTLSDATTSYLWASSTGGVTVTATTTPSLNGDFPLAKVVTSGGAVTSITDYRVFLEPNRDMLRLVDLGEEQATAANVDYVAVEQDSCIDRIRVKTAMAASGATGSTIFDIVRHRAGATATLFTSGGSNRPTLAAGDYTSDAAFPEVTFLQKGDFLELQYASATSGGTPASYFQLDIVTVPVQVQA